MTNQEIQGICGMVQEGIKNYGESENSGKRILITNKILLYLSYRLAGSYKDFLRFAFPECNPENLSGECIIREDDLVNKLKKFLEKQTP